MNGREAMKLMLDGNMVKNDNGVVYKILNNEICIKLYNEWKESTLLFSEFITMENLKEYKEPIILKRKCLIIGDNILYLNKGVNNSSRLNCNDVQGCRDMPGCSKCIFKDNGYIDSTDERIKEINFIIQ